MARQKRYDARVTSPAEARAERRRLETRREIVDAAFDVFAEKGYHAATISDIAVRVGLGHGTFYRHFENKQDILDHVMGSLIERIVGALAGENAPEAASTLAEYRAQVERIGLALAEAITTDRRVARLALLNLGSIDPAYESTAYGLFSAAAALTAQYLQHGVDLGYLRADLDVLRTANAVNGIIMAAVIQEQHEAGAGVEYIGPGINLVFDGIVARADG
jgi:AcrR family transcriptional regulator